ncbi:putative superoxide dismutase [Diaporthe ampelina]|uniref:superoxide dismutase n=1 Tax=Diaporthe ampelina TaxID=1214573 RepID=A0A0G2FWK7_9PEZI|nr:putative superoxide dismutase [Diaporthe ampelina]
MRMSIATAILAAASVSAQNTGVLGDAAVVSDNPVGAVYKATLPDTAFTKSAYPNGGNVKGDVYAVSSPDGTGVIFKVKFSGLPSEGGPFIYHLHDQPVPEDGNCTSTLAHLDPYERGETTPCDSNAPQTCQVGDLSGKHGKITGDIDATYTDNFASLKEGIGAFFGNRSIVVHFGNKTRITCANFERVDAGNTCETGTPSSTASSTGTAAPTSQPTGGATPTTGSPIGSNATATGSSPSATTSFVQAAGNANAPTVMLAAGAAALAFLL